MQTTNAIPSVNRCQHRTPKGRQCCSPAIDSRAAFCTRHTVALAAPNDSTDFSAHLIPEGDHFQFAQQINHSLISLYKLVATGRISPRRASVLAYIAHLILSSHKAIDYDNRSWRQRTADPTIRPAIAPLADLVDPGNKPLPATAEEFVTEALTRSRNSTS
jgi:hypothetical protein